MAAVVIRPLTHDDVEAAVAVTHEALPVPPPFDAEEREPYLRRRIADFAERHPAGSFVADEGGRIEGLALALVTDGIWGLSLLAVDPRSQSRGTGGRLLQAALGHGPAHAWIIASTVDPRAMRLYANAGLQTRPCLAAAGIVDRSRLPRVDGAQAELDLEQAAAISRTVRGGAYGAEDLVFLLDVGRRPLSLGDRGFALHHDGSPVVLCARDDEAAAELLWACLAASPRGGTVHVDYILAGQDWAIRTVLAAGLDLSPDGPLFTRGELGPLRPWLPSGAFL